MTVVDVPRIIGVGILLAIIATKAMNVKDIVASRDELQTEQAYRWDTVLF